jgi:hypothetical protein
MPYQEALVGSLDLAHNAFKRLCHSFGIQHASGEVLVFRRPLGRALADLPQLPVEGQPCTRDSYDRADRICSETLARSSGDTEEGRVDING